MKRKILIGQLIFSFGLILILTGTSVLKVQAADRGATVPFKTFEAEDASIGGGASKDFDESIREVSSEKSYVHLNGNGAFVEFSNLSSANRLTVRYSIPKNVNGTISLYLNGVHNQNIQLTHAQCWDWEVDTKTRRYDEKSVIIQINAGDRIKLQKDADDACSSYSIDLIDIETAPEPLTMPANYVSITDFGATGNDTSDDTQAIKDCISAAAAQGKGVWIPAGTFHQNTRITMPENLIMTGAGIWHSTIHNTVAGTTYSNDVGYGLVSGNTFSDIKFTGVGLSRLLAAHLFRPIGSHQTLKNLWIQNVACVYGWSPNNGLDSYNTFKDSRVFGTYFDGVHWGDGNSYYNLVENVYFRGLGDDAVAQVNRTDKILCHDNVAKFNTIIASYWGRGLANIGGDKLTYTDNYISSSFHAGLMIATELLSVNARPINGFQFLRNTIHKCGSYGHNHGGIHVWLKVNPMQDVVIKDNIIEYGQTEGIHIDNTDFGDAGGRIIFENNIVRFNAKGSYTNQSDDIMPILKNNNGFPGGYNSISSQLNNTGNSIKVFPNPVGSFLTIQSDVEFDSVSVHNSAGSKVYARRFDQERTSSNLDFTNLSPGVYVLEIKGNQLKRIQTIIKL